MATRWWTPSSVTTWWRSRPPRPSGADVLRRAHEGDPDATDDATLVEEVGGIVLVVEGEPTNLKITGPVDLAIATLHLS